MANGDMPGHFIPWVVADLLNVDTTTPLYDELLAGWFQVHEYLLFMDDLLDNPLDEHSKTSSVAAALCLQRALGRLYQPLRLTKQHIRDLDRYWIEAARAVVLELDGTIPISMPDLRLGSSMALLKLWAYVLLIAEGREHEKEFAESVVGTLTAAIQLLDAIQDWEEDWTAHRPSYLLEQAFPGPRPQLPFDADDLSSQEVLAVLVDSGALARTLVMAGGFLERVRETSDQKPARIARLWADERLESCARLQTAEQAARLAQPSSAHPSAGPALSHTQFRKGLKKLHDLLRSGYLAQ